MVWFKGVQADFSPNVHEICPRLVFENYPSHLLKTGSQTAFAKVFTKINDMCNDKVEVIHPEVKAKEKNSLPVYLKYAYNLPRIPVKSRMIQRCLKPNSNKIVPHVGRFCKIIFGSIINSVLNDPQGIQTEESHSAHTRKIKMK